MVVIKINSPALPSTKLVRQAGASPIKMLAALLVCSIVMNISQFQKNNYTIVTQPIKPQSSQRQLSAEKGFHPIYVYSNAKIAQGEVPERSSIKENPRGDYAYAQVYQDYIILALTNANAAKDSGLNSKSPFFLDLAANDALKLSNTLHLEQNGWDGLCIEGSPEYWYGLGRYRKCTVVGAFVGGQESNDGSVVDIALGSAFGGIVGEDMDNKPDKNHHETKGLVKRELVSLATILKDSGAPHLIDYFSLDVEGAETLIMNDFPWDQYTFRFMTIERPRDDLVNMLKEHGYREVKQLIHWGETLWAHDSSIKLSQKEMEDIIERAKK